MSQYFCNTTFTADKPIVNLMDNFLTDEPERYRCLYLYYFMTITSISWYDIGANITCANILLEQYCKQAFLNLPSAGTLQKYVSALTSCRNTANTCFVLNSWGTLKTYFQRLTFIRNTSVACSITPKHLLMN